MSSVIQDGYEIDLTSMSFVNTLNLIDNKVDSDGYSNSARHKRSQELTRVSAKAEAKLALIRDVEGVLIKLLIKKYILTHQVQTDQTVADLQDADDQRQQELRARVREAERALAVSRAEATLHRLQSRAQPTRPVPPRDASPIRTEPPNRERTRPTGGVTNLFTRMEINEDKEEKHEVKVFLDPDHKQCTICHQPLTRQEITVLKCGHCFHFICANRWYRTGGAHSCAICRNVDHTAPITPGEARSIIGERLDEVFGPEPRV
jgi:hypothetical protein